jgi:hypothetical protein
MERKRSARVGTAKMAVPGTALRGEVCGLRRGGFLEGRRSLRVNVFYLEGLSDLSNLIYFCYLAYSYFFVDDFYVFSSFSFLFYRICSFLLFFLFRRRRCFFLALMRNEWVR